jgi:ribosome-associated protein
MTTSPSSDAARSRHLAMLLTSTLAAPIQRLEDSKLNDSRQQQPDDANFVSQICLDDYLKTHGVVGTGGQAKMLIQSGDVRVNGERETRRRRKLSAGDVIELLGQRILVQADDQTP